MKLKHCVNCSTLAAIFCVVAVTGCDKKSENAPAKPATGSSPPAVKSDLPLKEFEISGNDQMKFSVTTMEAQAGQPLKVVFKNVGTMPKASMGHNWALLAKGTDPVKLMEAGFAAAATDYIPPDMAHQVIAKTKILGPGESETLTFNAPSEPGSYEYICSFPGHFAIGMKGTLTVK